MTKPPFHERVVRTDTGCLLFTGGLNTDGYGVVKLGRHPDGRQWLDYFHRLMWIRHHGAIAAGLVIEHVCHTEDLSCPGGKSCLHRACGDVEHMRLVTAPENTDLGIAHRRAREEQYA